MTGVELVLFSSLINLLVSYLGTPDPEPICSLKTYISYEEQVTEVQRPVYCKDIGL
ncbi:hypothetical protein [Marinomonas sp. PE14-40]|uniref:hypothetical protein n=1 Tax=Marinomonas sp. PE14-40 TaxID=3060621 RepID=UPI003F672978